MNATQNTDSGTELTFAEQLEVRYAIDTQLSRVYREYLFASELRGEDDAAAKGYLAMIGHLTRSYGKIAGPDFELDGWIDSFDDKIVRVIRKALES